MLTALVEPWISTEWARSTPAWLQVVILSLAGMPTYICATAATPFAALLLAKGFAPGAVIAFLLTGPATNLTTFGALSRLHSRGVAWAFVGTAALTTCVLGWSINAFLPADFALAEHAHDAGEHAHGALAWSAAAVLGALTIWVLLREGPRAFLGQLAAPDGTAPGHHHHHHGGGHAHGGHAPAAEARCGHEGHEGHGH